MASRPDTWILGFGLREAIFLCFCGLSFAAFKIFLRFKFGLSGHSMLPFALVLVMARGFVPHFGAATVAALVAGLALSVLGVGKGGPLVLLKTLGPGLAIDLVAAGGASLLPLLAQAPLYGAAVALGRAPGHYAVNRLAGMEADLAFMATAVRIAPAFAFATAGALLALLLVRRLARVWQLPRGRITGPVTEILNPEKGAEHDPDIRRHRRHR